MGWAARARESKGNPTRPAVTVTFIRAQSVTEQRRLGIDPVARFSDREYVIRANGELRRRQPGSEVNTMPLTTGNSGSVLKTPVMKGSSQTKDMGTGGAGHQGGLGHCGQMPGHAGQHPKL